MNLLIDEPDIVQAGITVVLAHGAGAGMESDFMAAMATGLCLRGVRVVRFEFPYMDRRRETGKKRPPDRMPVLEAAFVEALTVSGQRCIAAGKSMGGRVASMMLAQKRCEAAISLGYPFHPPGKPEKLRNEHWPDISRPWLIVQGTRDPFGTRDDIKAYRLPDSARMRWLDDGDHDFKARKLSGFSQAAHWESAINAMTEFVMEF